MSSLLDRFDETRCVWVALRSKNFSDWPVIGQSYVVVATPCKPVQMWPLRGKRPPGWYVLLDGIDGRATGYRLSVWNELGWSAPQRGLMGTVVAIATDHGLDVDGSWAGRPAVALALGLLGMAELALRSKMAETMAAVQPWLELVRGLLSLSALATSPWEEDVRARAAMLELE